MTTTRKRRIKKVIKPKLIVPPRSQQRLVRTSERGVFQSCLHHWQWSYLERRKPLQESVALSFGDLVHRALEKRYPKGVKRGPHPARTFKRLYKKFTDDAYELGFRDEDGEWQNLGDIGVDMMENYVDHFGDDSEWEVIASECTFQVPVFEPCDCNLSHRATCARCHGTGQVYVFTYVGTLDGLWRNRVDGGIRINDYKTCKGDPEQEMRNVGYTGALGLQPGAYWTFGVEWLRGEGILGPKLSAELDGMVFTYLRKGSRDTRPQDKDGYYLNQPKKADLVALAAKRGLDEKPQKLTVEKLIGLIGDEAYQLGEVSKNQPPPLIHREVMYRSDQERDRYRERAIRQVKKMIDLENAESEAREKMPDWIKCRMCEFRDACELHELDTNWEDYLDGTTEEWDPYSAHEIEQEGRK